MERNKAVRLPFKQPRRVTEPTDAFFKKNNCSEGTIRQNATRGDNSTTKASYLKSVPTSPTPCTGRYLFEVAPVQQRVAKEQVGRFTSLCKEIGESRSDYIEDQTYSIPVEPLDHSSLWEEEWLGDADDFELLDIITLHSAKESAA